MTNALELVVRNEIPEIARAIATFSRFAEDSRVPIAVSRRTKIVFDELLNNVISYAYPDGGEHEISIQVERSDDRMTLVFIDDGIAFNPLAHDAPDTDLPLEEREVGGMGIHLVQQVMDEVSYERRGDKNALTLEKKLHSEDKD